ncbi:MAG: hypothetical protein ACOZQL_37960 [Myxococcota bacterium]
MRSATVLLCVSVLWGCAHVPRGAPEGQVRIYELPLERTRALVFSALAERGIVLKPTAEPNVFASAPRVQEVRVDEQTRTGPPVSRLLVSSSSTWVVVFQPVGPRATGVRVLRADQLAGADQAERSYRMAVAFAPSTVKTEVAQYFTRDREAEAVVAAVLDGEPAVEVTDPELRAELEQPLLAPLPDLPKQAPLPAWCGLALGALEGAFVPGQVILLADPLGTAEPFTVLDGLICQAASRRLPLTVALSISATEQAALNEYLASSGDAAARARLLAGRFWNRPWQDGRSSLALADFLERVRARRAEGAPVTVLAVDLEQSGNARNARITSVLLRHREVNPGRLVVALLGNVLVSRRQGTPWDATLLPVGARLAAVLPDETHAFDVAYEPGTHWACHLAQRGALACGTWAAIPGPRQQLQHVTPQPFFRAFERVSPDGFDGLYFVGGPVSASVPAVESRRGDEGRVELKARVRELPPFGAY